MFDEIFMDKMLLSVITSLPYLRNFKEKGSIPEKKEGQSQEKKEKKNHLKRALSREK